MTTDLCGCDCSGPHLDVHMPAGATPGPGVRGEKQKAVVSSTARVCKGEFVQRVLEYVSVGDKLRWGLEDIHILDAVELSQERVGVVFAQHGQTKFKLLALDGEALALGNTLVLVEDEALETAALLELRDGRALVAYNQEAAGVVAVISMDGRRAVLDYTDMWGEGDPENICVCRINGSKALIGCMQLHYTAQGGHIGEAWVRPVTVGETKLILGTGIRVDGNNDTDVYTGGWSLVEVTEDTAVLVYPQGLDKPVGFAVIDVADDVPAVRLISSGKYAASLPTIQAVALDDGRWAMVYGIGWLSPDKQVVKSTLALEVWGLTRYAAELIWYGCEDTRYASAIGGVSAVSHSMGAAITYTGEYVARVIHLGVMGTPYAGPGVVLGSHGGFCRVVPVSLTRALVVSQADGNGYVGIMETAERVIPSDSMIHGVAITGGDPGQEIVIKQPFES
ncbi:hypothetical protein [Vermiculatibacterium agrestimuris]|uniref:hypothetical protein n=1 Tax=Vermiculatibacterium agrestimuris TaxID=2941519 RepID=UPI00204146CD|nr:hypothetical protein [Vermiculatibacterium agrestimuris]